VAKLHDDREARGLAFSNRLVSGSGLTRREFIGISGRSGSD